MSVLQLVKRDIREVDHLIAAYERREEHLHSGAFPRAMEAKLWHAIQILRQMAREAEER